MNSGHEKEKKEKAVGQSLIRLHGLLLLLFFGSASKTHLPDKMTRDDPGDIKCGRGMKLYVDGVLTLKTLISVAAVGLESTLFAKLLCTSSEFACTVCLSG